MTDFIRTIWKNTKTEKDTGLSADKYSEEWKRAQSRIVQNALVQRRFYEEAKDVIGETIEDMDKKVSLKTIKETI